MPESKVAQARIGWQKSSSDEEEANRPRRRGRMPMVIQGSRHCPRLVDTRSVVIKYDMQEKEGPSEEEETGCGVNLPPLLFSLIPSRQ